jgi:uncharacterized repeat protein (TIGR01451 family)
MKVSIFLRRVRSAAIALALAVLAVDAAQAANNQGTGDIAGDATALTASNVFVLNSSGALTLVKRAFLGDGSNTPIASGTTLAKGTVVKFMIYMNNPSGVTVSDVSMRDVLDPLFAYQANSIKVNNAGACAAAACTAAEEATIFGLVQASAALTDAVDADTVTYTAGTRTVDAGNQNAANAQLNAAANKVLAVSFTVTMQ